MSKWMMLKNAPESAHIAVFRCKFNVKAAGTLSFRFSADEHAQIFLDGERICEGPERGVPERWYWKDVSTSINAGDHILSARVLCFGKSSAYGQLTVKHGFCLSSSSLPLENWECREENGLSFTMADPDWGNYPRVEVSGDYCDQVPYGGGDGWQPEEFVLPRSDCHAWGAYILMYPEVID